MKPEENRFSQWLKRSCHCAEYASSEIHLDVAKASLNRAVVNCAKWRVKAHKAAKKLMKIRS